MAQTQHAPQHNVEQHPATTASEADRAAWCEAATARKYRVHDGMPYSYGSEMIFPLPAPVGFAALHPGVRPLIFQSVAQFVTNRIGQVQDGNVASKIAAALSSGDGLPSANANDAFDAAYSARIGELVEAKLGPHSKGEDGKDLTGDDLKAAKAKRDGIILASCNSDSNKAKYFEASVREAIERGQNKPASGKAKRAPKATSGGMEL